MTKQKLPYNEFAARNYIDLQRHLLADDTYRWLCPNHPPK